MPDNIFMHFFILSIHQFHDGHGHLTRALEMNGYGKGMAGPASQ
jgi:hypothetical protein